MFADYEARLRLLTQRKWILRFRVAAALLAVFLPIALTRLIDGDEGYLLYAARLVSEGRVPYRNFFFQQTPMVPLVFGGLFSVFGRTWTAARLLSAFVAVAIGTLVYEITLLQTKKARWAIVAVVLYAGCGFTVAWLPIVKTYGLAMLFLIAAAYCLVRGGSKASLVAGTLIILAAGTRLYLGLIGVNAAVYVLRRDRFTRRGLLEVGKLTAGAVFGVVLLLPAILPDPRAFWFGTIEFINFRLLHQVTFFGRIDPKIDVLFATFTLRGSDGGGTVQFVGLFVLGLASLLSPRTAPNSLMGSMWITMWVANLLPQPTFTQYTCVLIPFIAVEAVRFVSTLDWDAIGHPLWGALVVYLLFGAYDVYRYTVSGVDVPGVTRTQPKEGWRISTAVAVGRKVDEIGAAEAGATWPGYFVSARTPLVMELGNDFGVRAGERLSASERSRYHVMSYADMSALIASRRIPVYVMGNWPLPFTGQLTAGGFRQSARVENAVIWSLPQGF